MKILFLNYKYSYVGGSEQCFISQIKILQKNNNEIIVICSDENRIKLKNVKCYFIKNLNKISKTIKNIIKLKKIIKLENPDIAYIHNNDNPFLNFYISSKIPSIKFIHSYDHICPVTSKYIEKEHCVCKYKRGKICFKKCILLSLRNIYIISKNFIEPYMYSKYKYLITFSNYMKIEYSKLYKNNILKIPYYFSRIPKAEDNKKDENIVLFVGRFIKSKGIYELVDICSKIKNNYILYLVGDGPERKKLEKYAETKKIHFKAFGWLNNFEIQKLYLRSSVLAVPSIWPEPFGIIGLEAMSFKIPIVAFNNGGISEWLKNKYNGFLIDNNSKSLFAEKIDILLKNKEFNKQLGKNGFNYLKKKFDQKRSLEFLLNINKELQNKRNISI